MGIVLGVLGGVIVLGGCAFVVMKQGITSLPSAPAFDGYMDVMRLLIGATINGEPEALQAMPIDGVPSNEGQTIVVSAFLLTALFGFIGVLLLLSMIIARFSGTVASISNSRSFAIAVEATKSCANTRADD